MTRRLLAVALALACCTSSLFAVQQTLSADEKELAAYRLTMTNVKKTGAVMKALAEIEAADPKKRAANELDEEGERLSEEIRKLEEKEELTEAEQARLEKLNEQMNAVMEKRQAMQEAENRDEKDDDKSSAQSLSDWEARMKKEPRAAAVLNREGISARDFAKTFLTLIQASMVVGFSQGKVDFAKLPPGINPENVKFVLENKEALEAMQADWSPKKKK